MMALSFGTEPPVIFRESFLCYSGVVGSKEEAFLRLKTGVEELQPTADKTICWNWVKGKDRDGYGVLQFDGKQWRAHRLAYYAWRSEIPAGMVVRHACDNPSCIRPNHLILGSVADNNRDRDERGRTSQGTAHYRSKVTAQAAREIRRRYDPGDGSYIPGRKGRAPGNGASLRREFGISRSTMYRVLKGDQ